jgi:hypothetical protein
VQLNHKGKHLALIRDFAMVWSNKHKDPCARGLLSSLALLGDGKSLRDGA